jgi:sugar phosphate isomerase/epimerase
MPRCSIPVAACFIGVIAISSVIPAASPNEKDQSMINVGLQLYSFRAQMEKDVPGTLELAHKMGVTDVEVAGLYKLSPEQFRALLDKNELKASGIHFQWDQFSKDLDGIIKECKALGVEYVTLPWIPHKGEFTIENAHDAAAKFNEWGEKLSQAGLKFTYHAHGYEFRPYEKGTLFDVMVAVTMSYFVSLDLELLLDFEFGV